MKELLLIWLDQILTRLGFSLLPHDRILSAISTDGIHWKREKGLRINIWGPTGAEMVYQPHISILPAGNFRMYYRGSFRKKGRWKSAIYSAISSEGLSWRHEPQARLNVSDSNELEDMGSPSVIQVSEGGWRMYFVGFNRKKVGRVYSAFSIDGLKWNIEPGTRVTESFFKGVNKLVSCFVIRTEAKNLFRMYISVAIGHQTNIQSAISLDGLNWKSEPGIRVSIGGPEATYLAGDPCVVPHDGGWRMYYRSGHSSALGNDIYWASSHDGLKWKLEGISFSHDKKHSFERHAVAFPFVLKLADGYWRLYYTGYWGKHFLEQSTLRPWLNLNNSINKRDRYR